MLGATLAVASRVAVGINLLMRRLGRSPSAFLQALRPALLE
jgi:hypothetical protein